MPSKWCCNCQKIVSTNTTPKYCCWCGKDLRADEILPEFNSWSERERIVSSLIKTQILETKQLSLF